MRDASFRDFVLDQLDGLPGVRSRGMFGGHGLYLDDGFFGLIWKGRLFLRTDETSRAEYKAMGSVPAPIGDTPETNAYWSVPEDVLEDARLLRQWVVAAAAVPRTTKRKRAPKRPVTRRRARPAP